MARILVTDDKPSIRKMLCEALKAQGHAPKAAAGGREALGLLAKGGYDLLLTDVRMPEMDGVALLKAVRGLEHPVPVVLMTAFGSVETAVEAMKLGASDYLPKPFSLDQLSVAVSKALQVADLQAENRGLAAQVSAGYAFKGVEGGSAAMKRVHALVKKVAATDSVVMIEGESGTGKELVAQAIHLNGPRKAKPFLKVNCAALPEGLVESELFGHERGAFTGAHERRLGRFELATGGTLFLDEVGDIPLPTQVKLLRVLQEKEFERVGGVTTLRSDVRVIAASNRDLRQAVARREFREDLYFRLNVVPLRLPPLRERAEDIPALARHLLDKHRLEAASGVEFRIDPKAMKRLREYPWPGNVRELENVLQRAMVLAGEDGYIHVEHLPLESSDGQPRKGGLAGQVEGLERRMIREALEAEAGHQSGAARRLGLNRTLLIYKMKKYGIDPKAFKPGGRP